MVWPLAHVSKSPNFQSLIVLAKAVGSLEYFGKVNIRSNESIEGILDDWLKLITVFFDKTAAAGYPWLRRNKTTWPGW